MLSLGSRFTIAAAVGAAKLDQTSSPDATEQIVAKGLLDVAGNGIVIRAGLASGPQPGLQVLLHELVEHRLLRSSRRVDPWPPIARVDFREELLLGI